MTLKYFGHPFGKIVAQNILRKVQNYSPVLQLKERKYWLSGDQRRNHRLFISAGHTNDNIDTGPSAGISSPFADHMGRRSLLHALKIS